MKLGVALAQTAEVFEPKTFCALREQLDPEWITQALQATDTVTVRRRRLPAEEMIWSVIGMALLRDRTITDVARSLSLDGRGPKKLVGASAVSQARSRLGKEPLAWLFCHSAKVWAHKSADKVGSRVWPCMVSTAPACACPTRRATQSASAFAKRPRRERLPACAPAGLDGSSLARDRGGSVWDLSQG
jgi:hypothetical protein